MKNGKALRSQAPAAIAYDIDAVLDALEKANPAIQAATTMDEMMTAYSGATDEDFMEHANKISAYDEAECGNASDAPVSPSDD